MPRADLSQRLLADPQLARDLAQCDPFALRRFGERYLGEDLDGLSLRFAKFDWTLVP